MAQDSLDRTLGPRLRAGPHISKTAKCGAPTIEESVTSPELYFMSDAGHPPPKIEESVTSPELHFTADAGHPARGGFTRHSNWTRSINRPTNKFVPLSATLPAGNGIPINTAPKLHGYAVILMRCIRTAIHPCHPTFVIWRGRASSFFVVEPKRIHVGIYPQSSRPIT